MRILTLLISFCLSGFISNAQLTITDEPSALALVQRLLGGGVSVSNVVFTGDPLMAGRFKNNSLTNIGLDSGIVLTSGSAKSIPSQFVTGLDGDGLFSAFSTLADTDWFLPGDADLASIVGGGPWYDACALEFDFIPSGDTISFRYVLSSEEYTPAYVCTYNDAFAFLLSGPGITGIRNIALVPGTNVPVSIVNVNNVANLCPSYPAYYVDNELNTYFTHDGHTTVLTAQSRVTPCSTYHLKIVIADFLDGMLDSGVFLEDKSLRSNEPPALDSVSATAAACGGNQITLNFSEPIICSSIQTTDFTITGPAGPYTVTSWTAPLCTSPSSGTEQITLTVNPPLATNGVYQVCLTAVTGSVADLCGNIAPVICLPINVSPTIPAFNLPTSFCTGSVVPVLPTVSPNGVTGIWNPAVVSSTVSATYTFTPTLGQCAVPVSYPINVLNGGTSTTSVTICNNSLPYAWNGNTYPAAGTYNVNLTTPTGCDSVATLILTTNAVVTGSQFVSLCSDQFPYTWNGNTYNAPGAYSITLVTASGCDSVVTLNISENAIPVSTSSVSVCNNQFPYSWNGNSYNAAGTYSVTLTGSSGCDSIATLQLSASSTTTSTTSLALCTSQFPYTWNGNTYNSAGTYNVNLTGASGCDSIATLILGSVAPTTSTTAVSICTSLFPYSWNGNSYSSAGTYTVNLINSGGCDSVATLILTGNSVSSSTTAVSICSSLFPYLWNGNTYSTAGTYNVVLVNSVGCDSVATLLLTANAPTSSTTNVAICTNQFPYTWNGTNYPASGTYNVMLINSAGCDSTATLVLTANSLSSSTTPIAICTNQFPYTWNGNNYPAAGTYNVTLVNSAGCDSTATLVLTANALSSSTTPVTICANQFPYTWNGNNYPTIGTYSVTLVNSVGCDSTATLLLTSNAVSSSTSPVTICANQFPYIWNGNTYSAAGSYSVTLTNSAGCDSVATLVLTANAVSASTTPVAICTNQFPYTWNGNSYAVAGSYNLTLTNSAGCDSVATLVLTENILTFSTTPVAICTNQFPYTWNGNNYPVAGAYVVTLTNAAGCDSTATLVLTENALSSSTTPVALCTNQFPYTWNGNTYSAAGTYTASFTNAAGCDSTATLILTENALSSSTTPVSVCTNQFPYTWNGNNYAAAGTYVATLTNSAGCDSTATLILTETTLSFSTTAVSICTSQLPYSWNGNVYNASGSYSVNLVAASGCDSVATLVLTAGATTASNTSVSLCDSQFPYSWNGNSYAAPGTFTVTLLGSGGCDSIATLILTTAPIATSTTSVSVCPEALPYSWNGNSYSIPGTYNVTLIASSGCDSIATLNLVSGVTSSNTVVSVCNAQLPYAWNGTSYSTPGSYNITLTGSAGCDSLATLVLNLSPLATSSTPVSVCDNQLPYTWNGNVYNVPGTYNVNLTTLAGCDSVATLILSSGTTTSSNTVVSICNNQLPYQWNGNSYSTTGTYNITLTGAGGCDSIATLVLNIGAVSSSLTTVSACPGDLPFVWNGNAYNSSGSFTATLINSAGCDSVATLALTVGTNSSSTTAITLCPNQLPYTWNGNTYTGGGTFNITLANSSGCDSIATLVITALPTPAAPAVVSPLVYCQYDVSAPLIATANPIVNQLLWYTTASGGTGSTTIPTPSTLTTGVFEYFVSQSNGCEGPRSPIVITVKPSPYLGADKTHKICFGATADVRSLYAVAGLLLWTDEAGNPVNPAALNQGGVYTLTSQNAAGCRDTASLSLIVNSPVFANAGPDSTVETNLPHQLNGTGSQFFQWTPAGPLNNPFIANPVATLDQDQVFVLTTTDDIGCLARDTVSLRVLDGPTFYVPSAFTPNGDGLNDFFAPTTIGISSIRYFRVYNRLGELLFESSSTGRGWDGTYKGKRQGAGNYVWTVNGIDRFGKNKNMKGNVVLIR